MSVDERRTSERKRTIKVVEPIEVVPQHNPEEEEKEYKEEEEEYDEEEEHIDEEHEDEEHEDKDEDEDEDGGAHVKIGGIEFNNVPDFMPDYESSVVSLGISQKYVPLTPIEQALQYRKDFDLIRQKCVFRKDQLTQLFRCFKIIDTSQTGYIEARGVRMFFRAMGLNPSSADIRTLIKKAGKQIKGKVTFKEFVDIVKDKVDETMTSKILHQAFNLMDYKDKKYLRAKEIRSMAKILKIRLEKEEAQEMVLLSDYDKDKVVNYADFVRAVCKTNIYM